jgi:osmoprotectant transport system permease protein
LRLSGFSLFAASILALPPAICLGHIKRGGVGAVWLVNIGRAVPSFAIIVLIFPISLRYGFGLGFWPTAFALILLAIPPIFTNAFTGVRDVDAGTVEAARGMGMQAREVVWGVEIPAALPLIITGLRVSAVQVVATATLGAYVGFGGLGAFIVEGFATQNDGKLLTGAVLVALMSLVVELVFGRIQSWLTPWTKGDLLIRQDPRAFDIVNETIIPPPASITTS